MEERRSENTQMGPIRVNHTDQKMFEMTVTEDEINLPLYMEIPDGEVLMEIYKKMQDEAATANTNEGFHHNFSVILDKWKKGRVWVLCAAETDLAFQRRLRRHPVFLVGGWYALPVLIVLNEKKEEEAAPTVASITSASTSTTSKAPAKKKKTGDTATQRKKQTQRKRKHLFDDEDDEEEEEEEEEAGGVKGAKKRKVNEEEEEEEEEGEEEEGEGEDEDEEEEPNVCLILWVSTTLRGKGFGRAAVRLTDVDKASTVLPASSGFWDKLNIPYTLQQ